MGAPVAAGDAAPPGTPATAVVPGSARDFDTMCCLVCVNGALMSGMNRIFFGAML